MNLSQSSLFVRIPVRAAFCVRVLFVLLTVLALFFLSTTPANAQIPRGNKLGKHWAQPYNLALLRQYLTEGSFFHTVTVDSGGSGDFTTITSALAFVTAQNPTLSSQW